MGWVSMLEDNIDAVVSGLAQINTGLEELEKNTELSSELLYQLIKIRVLHRNSENILFDIRKLADIATDPQMDLAHKYYNVQKRLDELEEQTNKYKLADYEKALNEAEDELEAEKKKNQQLIKKREKDAEKIKNLRREVNKLNKELKKRKG